MFENNLDFDFDDNILLNLEKNVTTKPATVFPTRSNSKRIVERKFPGPAGLLPERHNCVESSPIEPSTHKQHEIPCSQSSFSVFQGEAWSQMLNDYRDLVEKFDINWIKAHANVRRLHNQKVPFLAAVVQDIECFNGKYSIVKVLLKDLTGEIHATVTHNLYEEQSNKLMVGSVVVLRKFSVLTTGTGTNHYVTITRKNLVTIYNSRGIEVEIVRLQETLTEDSLKSDKTQENTKDELSEEYMWRDAIEGLDLDSLLEDL